MSLIVDVFRTRLLPAVVAALGVSFIAAGLLSYVGAETGDDIFTRPTLRPEPTLIAQASDDPTPAPTPTRGAGRTPAPSATAGASAGASARPSAGATTAPSSSAAGTPAPSGAATPRPTAKPPKPTAKPVNRVATRVVVPALGIDLPVIKPPGGPTTYPVCNVAMYLENLSQPGLGGATYLYAHARTGMFLPLLENSQVNNGKRMIGMLVEVYTSDNQYFLYEIYQVRRHQLALTDAAAAKSQQLWLQTSEGPKGTPEKLQVVAKLLSTGPADPVEAHPKPKPVVCG
jgi:hypothetical protein